MAARLLVIDDKQNIRRVLKMILEGEGYEVETAGSGTEGLQRALELTPDLIISDIRMDDMSGTELFHMLRSRGMNIPFIFITAFASVSGAVAAIKEGAVDYLTKPIDYACLKRTIAAQLSRRRAVGSVSEGRLLVGSSRIMRELYERIGTVSETSSTVLITGESGTGKELVAREIHRRSQRSGGAFVPVNCAALSMSLLESELFGHEKGSFTGALQQKKGVFEIADKGSLFLDEVSEIDQAIQVKLLRVLQERSFFRVGGTGAVNVDVRVIAATNRRLEGLIERSEFRRDLYYRLNVIPINVPPLREHLEDLGELVAHFTHQVCSREGLAPPSIPRGFLDALSRHSWPGNVRELENLIERIVVLHRPRIFEERHLEEELAEHLSGEVTDRERIVQALRLCGGNKTAAAKLLGMPRRTLYYRIERNGILREEFLSGR